MSRKCALTTFDLFRLDRACVDLVAAYGHCIYLVGTAQTGPTYRDVDVRAILDDATFDTLLPTRAIWQAQSLAVASWLHLQTGLPIDFQFQRMTEANASEGTGRNPLGFGMRHYAGGGDATPTWPQEDK